ncbi:tetratricopeptide repeat protein [Musicola paradisiaca]|uniref:TPR repeat-containing protein n=1 Tax=Musicola paradisiaca (strain Ech703) TaxID=579405 RepID=C6C690_MUSP7|nr:TPR repeat-containing protein [Musicola paradisiaca Ech703]
MKYAVNMLLFASLAIGVAANASTGFDSNLMDIQKQWSICEYQTLTAKKESCFTALSQKTHALAVANPTQAEYLIWEAIANSSLAGAKGGLGALDLVKQAKATLEKAIAINPKALEGSAYTTLGALYYQVPGWPIGFGDNKKAEQYLKTALTINPQGIDPNYFYGDYLLKEGRKDEAKRFLNIALAAAPRPGGEIADQGRRSAVEKALSQLK